MPMGGKGRWEGSPHRRPERLDVTAKLSGIIHVEFNRAGSRFPAHDLFPFQIDVRIDLVVAEHVTARQEGPVVLKADERLAKRAADGRDVDQFLRWQVIEVLV